MIFQSLTLYLKPDVHLTGPQQEPTCRQALIALSKQFKPSTLYQITFGSDSSKVELLIGLQPTATSLEMSTSSALLEPLFSYSQDLPSIKYVAVNRSLDRSMSTVDYPCDVLTLRFPPSTSLDRRETCLQALDYLVSASRTPEDSTTPESPCKGTITGYIKEQFGVAGGDRAIFRAYIMWEDPEKEKSFKARHGGRHLWAEFDDVQDKKWSEKMGFYDPLEDIWATEGVDVESGWIKTMAKVEYMSRSARALSNAKAWMNSSGGH